MNENKEISEILMKHLSLERSGILSSDEPLKGEIIKRDMMILKDFLYGVSESFKLVPNTYMLTLEVLNIVVRNLEIQRDKLKLYGISSFFIVSKLTELYNLEIEEIIDISDNTFTEEEIIETETEIFKVLNYNLYLPNVSYFSINFATILGDNFDLENIFHARLYYYVFETYDTDNLLLPSVVAIASIYLGSMNFDVNNLELLSDVSNYTKNEILYVAYIVSAVYKNVLRMKRIIFSYLPTPKFGDITDYRNVYIEGVKYLRDKRYIFRPKYKVKEIESFPNEKYVHIEELGTGIFSTVSLIKYKGQLKALKEFRCIKLEGLEENDIKELSFLKILSNSNIISLNAVDIHISLGCSKVFVIMEYIEMDLLTLLKKERINTRLVKRYSLQLFNAVKYIHSFGILHGDIKSNNILVKGEDIKLIDFGSSYPYTYKNITKSELFTPIYEPIESFFTRQYENNADIWSCGVVIAEMIRREHLFKVKEEDKIREAVTDEGDTISIDPDNIKTDDWGQIIDEEGNIIPIDPSYIIVYNKDYQIRLIIELLGTDKVKDMVDNLPGTYGLNSKYNEPHYEGIYDMDKLKEYYQTDDELLIDLLYHTITVPKERLTIDECINHPWFMS